MDSPILLYFYLKLNITQKQSVLDHGALSILSFVNIKSDNMLNDKNKLNYLLKLI